MQVVFMRQGQCWDEDPSLRKPIFRFEPIGARDPALKFLIGFPPDPLPTLVGLASDDTILGEWIEESRDSGFETLWECEGSGLKKWQRAKDLKGAYHDSEAIGACASRPSQPGSIKPRL
jgi:hypothetical protein